MNEAAPTAGTDINNPTAIAQRAAAAPTPLPPTSAPAATPAPAQAPPAPAVVAAAVTPVAAPTASAPATTASNIAATTQAPTADTRRRALAQPRPIFPADALREGLTEGRVIATLNVGADGVVRDVSVISSTPTRSFGRAATNALRDWRYEAAPIGNTIRVELIFRAD